MATDFSPLGIDLARLLRGRAWGLITADRPAFDPAANRGRTNAMAHEPRRGLGLLIIEARRREFRPLGDPHQVETTLLLIGPKGNDHGRIKGALRSWGERYDQDVALWKKHHGDQGEPLWLQESACRHADTASLGAFDTIRVATLLDRLRGRPHDPAAWAIGLRRPFGFFTRRSPFVAEDADMRVS